MKNNFLIYFRHKLFLAFYLNILIINLFLITNLFLISLSIHLNFLPEKILSIISLVMLIIDIPISIINFLIYYFFVYLFHISETSPMLVIFIPFLGIIQWTGIFYLYNKIKNKKIKWTTNFILILFILSEFLVGYYVYNMPEPTTQAGDIAGILK